MQITSNVVRHLLPCTLHLITQQAPFPLGKRRAEPVEAGGETGPFADFDKVVHD